MICDRARHLFGACWDDELTQAERDRLEGHFASCPSCRAEYDEFSRALELTAGLPRIEASADFVDQVLARSRRATTAPDVIGEAAPRWQPVALGVAGALLVVAAVFAGSNLQWKAPASSQAPQIVRVEGPQEPRLTPKPGAKPGERRPEARRASAESLFDPDKNVEFILGSAAVSGGRVRRDPEGQRPVITF
jgi:anti-sigma factor RsiW